VDASAPQIRCAPEDFVVDEIPLYTPSGEGDHTFVRVEKRLRNTEEVAGWLAKASGVSRRDVGYAGRKDRVSVARQWFSVPGLDPLEAERLELPGVRVISALRHPHKLRTGHLKGNRFEIAVRNVSEESAERARRAAEEIRRRGFPNRFPIDVVEEGDVAVVEQSGGLFDVLDAARENPRAAAFEISATGPIFGTRTRVPSGAPLEREVRAMAACGVPDPLEAPRGVRLRGARRSLRARAADLELEANGGAAHLRFELPAGSYATVLLEELFGELRVHRGVAEVPDGNLPRPVDDSQSP
jgi:tRNA(Glu) U13 pseudouridine synthase TruD